MIFVHTNHATKVGKLVTLTLFSSQSLYCQLSEKLVYSSCELHTWPKSALERDSCPRTVRLHRATEEQGHSHKNQSRDLMLCLPTATKERRCNVCDEKS